MKHEINDTVLVPMKVVRILDSEDGKVLQLGAAFCNETKSYAVDILESELDPIFDGEMSNKDAAEIIKIARAEVEWEYPMEYAVAFGMAIEALDQEKMWIPVSERLPESFRFVNCTCHSLIDDREDWVVETVYIPQPHNSPYSDWGNIPMLNMCYCEVIAWMYRDIPEPYKASPTGAESDGEE